MKPAHRISLILAAVFTLTALAATSPAEAQYYRSRAYYRPHAQVVLYPRGLYFGAGLVGTRILDQRGDTELLDSGGGFTLYSGLRLNRTLALELGWTGTLHNPEQVDTVFGPDTDYLILNSFTGDAKIYLGMNGDTTEPFLQGGVGLYLLDSSYFGTQSVGTGFQLGGGVDFRVGDHVHLGGRALYRGIAMGPPNSAVNDTFVSAVTLEGNLTFRF